MMKCVFHEEPHRQMEQSLQIQIPTKLLQLIHMVGQMILLHRVERRVPMQAMYSS